MRFGQFFFFAKSDTPWTAGRNCLLILQTSSGRNYRQRPQVGGPPETTLLDLVIILDARRRENRVRQMQNLADVQQSDRGGAVAHVQDIPLVLPVHHDKVPHAKGPVQEDAERPEEVLRLLKGSQEPEEQEPQLSPRKNLPDI